MVATGYKSCIQAGIRRDGPGGSGIATCGLSADEFPLLTATLMAVKGRDGISD